MTTGDRIEIAPHLDEWVRGDRYGVVLSVTKDRARVRLDRSGRILRLDRDLVARIVRYAD